MAAAGTAWIDFLGNYSKLGAGSEQAIASMGARWKTMAKRWLGPALTVGAAAGITNLGRQFNDAYRTIRTGTGETGKALQGLQADFKAVLRTRPDNMKTVAAAITSVHQATGLTGTGLQSMTRDFLRLAKITGTDVTQNVKAAEQVFGSWQVPTDKMSDSLNAMYRASQQTGTSIGDIESQMSRFAQPLRQMGFGFDESAALIAKFQKEGLNTPQVLGAMRKGLATFAKEGVAPAEALDQVTASIQNAGSATEANRKAIEVFGARAGPELAAAIRQGRFAVGDLVKEVAGGSDTIEKSATDTATFSGKWQTFVNQMRVSLEPLATRVFGSLTDAMTEAQPALAGVASGVGLLAGNVNILLPAMSALIAMMAAGKLISGLKAIGILSQTLVPWPILLVVGAVAALAVGLTMAYRKVKWFHDAVDATWQGLQAAARAIVSFGKTLWRVFGPLATAVGRYFFEPFRTAIDVIVKLIHGDWRGALMSLLTLPLRILRNYAAIWGQIGSLVVKAFQAALPLIGQALAGLGALVAKGLAALGGVIGRAAAALPGQLLNLTVTMLTWAAETALKLGAAMLAFVPKLLGWIVEGAIKLPLFLLGLWIQIHAWVIETAVRLGIAMAGFVPQALAWVWNLVRQLPGALLRAWLAINTWIAQTAIRIAVAVARFVPAAIGWVGQVLRELPGNLAKIGTLIWNALTALPGLIAKAAVGIYKAFVTVGKGIFNSIVEGVKTAAKFVGNVAATIGKAVFDWIKAHVFKPLADWGISILGHKLKPFSGIIKAIGLASGGLIRRPTLALIGEAGPELVLPLNDPEKVAALLAAYAPELITKAQTGAAAAAGVEPTGIMQWADAVVARLALLPGQVIAATAPLTIWRTWMTNLLLAVAAQVNLFAIATRNRLAVWATREVPAATEPALAAWAARVLALFRSTTAQVSGILAAASVVWTRIASAAGTNYVNALTGKLNGGVNSVIAIVARYAKALAGGLNPILKAIGQPVIKLAKGGVVNFARGGLAERHVAQIAPAGAMRVWAEPETGGEAYIPLGQANRARSKAITEAVVRRFGGDVAWYRAGGVTGDTHGLNPSFLQRVNQWSDAVGDIFHITSGYRDIGRQQALYAKYLRGEGNLAAKPGSSMHNFGLAIDGPHWGNRNPAAFGLVYRVRGEPWHVEPIEAKAWRNMMPAGGWGDTPGVPYASLPDVPRMPHSGWLYDVADKAMKYTLAHSTDWAATALTTVAGSAPSVSGGALSSGSAVEIGRAMAAARGWTGAQWDALNRLWTKESGWRVNADNPTSSAYGIPQALPGSKMASFGRDWRTNPRTQIAWGLDYIAGRYRSPLAAWLHSQRLNWYSRGGLAFVHNDSFDNGGTLRPGLNLVRNDTGRPEELVPRRGAAVQITNAHFHEGIDYGAFLQKTAFMLRAGRL